MSGTGERYLLSNELGPRNEFDITASRGYLTGMELGVYHLSELSRYLAEAATKIRYDDDRFATVVEPLMDNLSTEITRAVEESRSRTELDSVLSPDGEALSKVFLFETGKGRYKISLTTRDTCPPDYLETGFYPDLFQIVAKELGVKPQSLHTKKHDLSGLPLKFGGGVHMSYYDKTGLLLLKTTEYKHSSTTRLGDDTPSAAGCWSFTVLDKEKALKAWQKVKEFVENGSTESKETTDKITK